MKKSIKKWLIVVFVAVLSMGMTNSHAQQAKELRDDVQIKEGKYYVYLGPKLVDGVIHTSDADMDKLKNDVRSLIPEGFNLNSEFDNEQVGVWIDGDMDTIFCSIKQGHVDYRTRIESMYYWVYYVSIWFATSEERGREEKVTEKLDTYCYNIAKRIKDKYEVKVDGE